MDINTDVSEKDVTLYPEQQAAKDSFLEWFQGYGVDTSAPGIFRIFGYAGTGKTTITKSIVRDVKGKVLFGAFTGKAALVMQRHGLPARTIHSLIYIPVLPDKRDAEKLRKRIEEVLINGDREKVVGLYKELKYAESIHFELNNDSDLNDAKLLVLDECSMVNAEMLNDILSFGVPLLVLGDPGQLPPIEGTGALVQDKPDVLLEIIHRQALENSIIAMSMKARTGQGIAYGNYGGSRRITKSMLTTESVLAADQVLTGKNVTRRMLNRKIRAASGRGVDIYPVEGDKLICLRNNAKVGIFNGLLCTVTKRMEDYDIYIQYEVKTEDGRTLLLPILRAYFDEYKTPGTIKSLRWWDLQEAEAFDFGYAITVHKSQGSQWDNVILYDDKFFAWDQVNRKRWFYTAITRAVETITLVQG